jgi:hypothetical protein
MTRSLGGVARVTDQMRAQSPAAPGVSHRERPKQQGRRLTDVYRPQTDASHGLASAPRHQRQGLNRGITFAKALCSFDEPAWAECLIDQTVDGRRVRGALRTQLRGLLEGARRGADFGGNSICHGACK